MNIHEATSSYEEWMAGHTRLVAADLEYKHELMQHSLFEFFRATFYRWTQLWGEVCAGLNKTQRLLAVGDLHVENFGTWRDVEGRLIWGCNDFDEADTLPYTLDLVRLAASAHLATESEHLAIHRLDASNAVLEGYRDGLEAGGMPYVLGEHHVWLRKIALSKLRDPVHFWKRMRRQPKWKGPVPVTARRGLEKMIPEQGLPYQIRRRVAGIGSLGHPRIVFLADYDGGWVAREAKALVPSACLWAGRQRAAGTLRYEEIVKRSVRVRDPFVRLQGSWVLRRLAPDCSRIALFMLPAKRDEEGLLYAMGWETANLHLGDRTAIPHILNDLKKRPGGWLHKAAKEMVKATRKDWKEWRRH